MESEHRRVLIIGSGPAGYTAAIYMARAGLEDLESRGDRDLVRRSDGGDPAVAYEHDAVANRFAVHGVDDVTANREITRARDGGEEQREEGGDSVHHSASPWWPWQQR